MKPTLKILTCNGYCAVVLMDDISSIVETNSDPVIHLKNTMTIVAGKNYHTAEELIVAWENYLKHKGEKHGKTATDKDETNNVR